MVVHAVGSQNSSDAVRPEELADSLLNLVNSDNSFKTAQPLYGSMSKIDSNHRVMPACVCVCKRERKSERAKVCVWVWVGLIGIYEVLGIPKTLPPY